MMLVLGKSPEPLITNVQDDSATSDLRQEIMTRRDRYRRRQMLISAQTNSPSSVGYLRSPVTPRMPLRGQSPVHIRDFSSWDSVQEAA